MTARPRQAFEVHRMFENLFDNVRRAFVDANTEQKATLIVLAAAGVVAAVLAAWLAVGLFRARSLVRREFGAYFLSPIAYVVLVVFLAVTGHLFAVTLGLLTAGGPKGT